MTLNEAKDMVVQKYGYDNWAEMHDRQRGAMVEQDYLVEAFVLWHNNDVKKKHTGLNDDYGTPINDGDTIEWTYYQHGILTTNDNGEEVFLGCVTGGEMVNWYLNNHHMYLEEDNSPVAEFSSTMARDLLAKEFYLSRDLEKLEMILGGDVLQYIVTNNLYSV